MKSILFSMLCVIATVFATGCVSSSSYKTLADVPANERPLYDVTYDYLLCSQNELSSQTVLGLGIPPKATAEDLQAIVDSACEACNPQLETYSAFILDKTGDKAFSQQETELLRQKANDMLLEKLTSGAKTL